jgi:hypothetical protein
MLDQLTRQDFTEPDALGITIDHASQRIALSVLEVRDLPPISPRQAPFAVILEGPRDPFLPQGIYPLVHPRHGRLDLFIVPIGRDAAHTRYEIIFN